MERLPLSGFGGGQARRAPLWLALLGLSLLGPAGCAPTSCAGLSYAPPDPPPEASAEAPEWAVAVVPDLLLATPATRLELRAGSAHVENTELVATWPAADLRRAREGAPLGQLDWPRVLLDLERPAAEGLAAPAITAALTEARRAERAATESGSGAGVYNLRVAIDVPWEDVDRARYSAALAGYGSARLLLAAGESERMLPWPRTRPRAVLDEAAVREVFRRVLEGAADTLAAPVPEAEAVLRAASLTLYARGGIAYLGGIPQSPRCAADAPDPERVLTFLPDVPSEVLARCLTALRARTEADVFTLMIGPDVLFGRAAPALQHAARTFPHLRVRTLEPVAD